MHFGGRIPDFLYSSYKWNMNNYGLFTPKKVYFWLIVTDWVVFFHVPELNQHQTFLGSKLVFLPYFYVSST